MIRKRLITLLFALLLLCAAPVSSASAANSVRVSLPDFPVTLNGQTLSNDYSKYPFLVYNNITYFPMTYSDCRLLGIQTAWSAAEGLRIEKTDSPNSEYARQIQTSKNAKTQAAQIATGKITVNGKGIDNSREEYPLLVFRDVTYFPLTWRFAVEEFGWHYQFDASEGLVISNLDARLTCTDTWSGTVEKFEAVPGVSGDTPLPCLFYAPLDGAPLTPKPNICLYNITGADVTVLPSDFQWEYQVYRVIGSREELIYRKAIPFYSGSIPAWQFACYYIDDTYDYSLSGKGAYRAVLVHPDYFPYELAGTTLSAQVEDSGYAVQFSREFTIN